MSSALTVFDAAVAFLAQDPGPGGSIVVTPIEPPGARGFLRLLGWARWIFTIFGILALFVAGGKFGYERWSHGNVESPKMVMGVIVGCIVVAAAPQLVYAALA